MSSALKISIKSSEELHKEVSQGSSVKYFLEMRIDPYVGKLLRDISKISTPYIVGGSMTPSPP